MLEGYIQKDAACEFETAGAAPDLLAARGSGLTKLVLEQVLAPGSRDPIVAVSIHRYLPNLVLCLEL